MNLEFSHAMDSIKDGTKEVAETAHAKTNEFHEKYVSTVIPVGAQHHCQQLSA